MVTYVQEAAKKVGVSQTIAAREIDASLWRLKEAGVVITPDDEYNGLNEDEALYMLFIRSDIELNMLGSEYWDATRAAMERKRNRLINTIEKLEKDKQNH